jgi:hypothetical protein
MIDLMGRQFLPHALKARLPSLTATPIEFDVDAFALTIAKRMVQAVSTENANG